MISCNSMTSNFHLHNSGNLSLKDFNAVSPDKSILRLDGIGFETFQGYKKQYQIAFMNKLISNSRAFIFQSNFAKAIFQDYYGDLISLKPHRVIINGSSRFYSGINQNSLIANHNIHLPTRYYVVAGRNVPRKRIDQINNLFKMLPQYNLVVLSDVRPSLQRFPNIYPIGLVAPEIARYIISNSIALIHFDFYDWCPNVVVNALYDGSSIICSNYGGTPEIVNISSNKHYIVREHSNPHPSLDFLCQSTVPPIPSDLIVDALEKSFHNTSLNLRHQKEFSIDLAALNYSDFIQSLSK